MPSDVKCVGQLDPNTGVDLQGVAVLNFDCDGGVAPALDKSNSNENTPKLPGCGVASLSFGLLGESSEETGEWYCSS